MLARGIGDSISPASSPAPHAPSRSRTARALAPHPIRLPGGRPPRVRDVSSPSETDLPPPAGLAVAILPFPSCETATLRGGRRAGTEGFPLVRTRPLPNMAKNPIDERGGRDHGDHDHLPSAPTTGQWIDFEHFPQEPGPLRAAPGTNFDLDDANRRVGFL
jgi:hypothetical protein